MSGMEVERRSNIQWFATAQIKHLTIAILYFQETEN